ncbi:MAG: zinc-dependent protease [Promethearchaeota archaeon CR_4]|nr:MAG: zinc-dependent protease [Candidatus Lokiarchaeota archaeon CR_4]
MGTTFDLPYDELWDAFTEFVDGFPRTAAYVDVLVDRNSSTQIVKSKQQEQIIHARGSFGVVARIFTSQWHEFAFQTPEEFTKIRLRMEQLKTSKVEGLDEFPSWKCNNVVPQKRPDLDVPLGEKLAKIREFSQTLEKFDARVINPMVRYAATTQERIFLNNEGCRLRQVIPRTRLFLQPIAKEGDRQDFDYESIGGEQGFELVENIFPEMLEGVVRNSVAMLKSVDAPSGKLPVILDPDLAGLVAHESFGHGLEADQILRKRSYLEPLFQQKVASELANISDSPAEVGQLGSFSFDDEGIKAGKNLLVEHGILTHYIYARRSASVLGQQPLGNGRRESFLHRVNERMTNTYFEPGDYGSEEIFKGIERGVFLEHGYFGMEDPLGGGIQCTSKKGWLIEHGKITLLLGPVTLSGRVLDLLHSIDAVTRTPFTFHAGTCGKGSEDYVPVTSGGSMLRAREAVVGPG